MKNSPADDAYNFFMKTFSLI